MKAKLGIVLLSAVSVLPAIAEAQVPTGRWEIVHTSGDSTAQTDLYPGGFSTYLNSDGSANTVATFANSICVINANGYNVVPTWNAPSSGSSVTITVAVDNIGLGPNVSFVYTGTYNANMSVPGDSSLTIPAITGTYYAATGDGSACSTTTSSSPGTFVATLLPDLSSGSSMGSLDSTDTDGGTPFDANVNATVNYVAPSTPGQIAGTVSLDSIPTLNHNACFASTNGTTPNDLTIDFLSNQAGILSSIYADGLDPSGNPTTLVLQGYSANLYITTSNTDPNANLVGLDEWAAAAAIGEDNPAAGTAGVNSDGTNTYIVQYYNVVGGACDGAGGSDAPFHFVSAKPIPHHGSKGRRHKHHDPQHREAVRTRDSFK